MSTLQQQLEEKTFQVLGPLMQGRAARICLIDPPGYSNVGDSAILLGELDFIKKYFPKAEVFFYDYENYTSEADQYIENASLIMIHGGGNFGDIWPHHHKLRMHILQRFTNKPIIQFPQSIHFDSADELAETTQIINAHPDFTLLARDAKSLSFAQKNFACKTLLCPDMAFSMRPITRKRSAVDVFCLLRTDKEVVSDHSLIANALASPDRHVEIDDWLNDGPTLYRSLDRRFTRWTKKHYGLFAAIAGFVLKIRRGYAEGRVRAGIAMLSRGKLVVTDRLHAHVMCTLLDIPHFIFDSYDGKVSAMYDTWTNAYAGAAKVANPAELRDLVPQHLG